MESNQQIIENITQFISQTVSLNKRLNNKKISINAAKLAFTQLDKKRKGYLDLADVFQLSGQVTQDQLFIVFKWLDSSKTGDVSYQDFQNAIAATQSTNDNYQQAKALENAKLVISTFLQNWDYSKGLKTKLNINQQTLTNFYLLACQIQRKNGLNVDDIISVLSNSKKFDSLSKQEVKSMFKSIRTINQKTFLEAFTFVNQIQNTQNCTASVRENINLSSQCTEQQLLDDINSQYLAQKHVQRSKNASTQEVNDFVHDKSTHTSVKRQNKYIQSARKQQYPVVDKKDLDFKTGDIESLLSNIEKRRQQLRKGSLQRKKLIDEALSRKKTNYSNFTSESNSNCTYQDRSYSRPVSTPKSNSYSQFGVNNYVDINKNDFGKIFNRYRDERENVLTIDTRSKKRQFELPARQCQVPESNYDNFMDKAYSTLQGQCLRSLGTPQSDLRGESFKGQDNYVLQTPKFSQTSQQRFFDRAYSANKANRIQQIRQKINHLPQRNTPFMQKESRQIDKIIEKYRNIKPNSNKKYKTPSQTFQCNQYSQRFEQIQNNGFPTYKNNLSPSNLRGIQNLNNYPTQQRKTPDSYIQDQKSRLNGSIFQYRSSTGNIQKQNLLKRAQEEASRKILQIQRKAKLKVLQRKSAVGLKWVK